MSIVPVSYEELVQRISLQRLVRPTLHFNTDAPPQLKEQGIDQVRIISLNTISLPPRIDEIDTKFLPDIKEAWARSIQSQLPPAHLIDKGSESLEDSLSAIMDPSKGRDYFRDMQKQEMEREQFPIPSEYIVSLPSEEKRREAVISVLIPFKELRDTIKRIDSAVDLKLRAIDIWNIKPPAIAALQNSLT